MTRHHPTGVGHTGEMSNDTQNGVTVVGSGRAVAAVDQVTVTLGVEVLRPEPGDAFRTAAGSVSSVLAVLSDNGVDARAVRTADLNLGPRTDYRDGQEMLLGYQASQRLIVRLDGLGSVERVLSEVVARGGVGVRIDGVTLSAGDPQDALHSARQAAFADAADKAAQYAQLAGRTLGAVQEVSETSRQSPQPMMAGYSRSSKSEAASMPVAGGDTDVTAAVQVRWAFADTSEVRPV